MNAVMLHHDAITGTHGGSVNQDYKRIMQEVGRHMDEGLRILNISENFNGSYDVLMFNPTAYVREEIVSVTVNSAHIEATSEIETYFELHP